MNKCLITLFVTHFDPLKVVGTYGDDVLFIFIFHVGTHIKIYGMYKT